jgi:hypothetical protein
MIEHRQRARPLVREVGEMTTTSGAASRSIPLPMPHLNLTYEALHPTTYRLHPFPTALPATEELERQTRKNPTAEAVRFLVCALKQVLVSPND